jgi:hypothetical protein
MAYEDIPVHVFSKDANSADPVFARGGFAVRRQAAGLQIQQERSMIYSI